MELPVFNFVDIAALGLVAYGLIQGLRRGLSGEMSRLISAGVALFLGWRYYQPLGELVALYSRLSEQNAHALAFILIMASTVVLLFVLRFILRQIMEISFKESFEKGGGAIAGTLRMAVIVALGLLCVGLWSHDYLHRVVAEESYFGRTVYARFPVVYDDLSKRHKDLTDSLAEAWAEEK